MLFQPSSKSDRLLVYSGDPDRKESISRYNSFNVNDNDSEPKAKGNGNARNPSEKVLVVKPYPTKEEVETDEHQFPVQISERQIPSQEMGQGLQQKEGTSGP